MKKEDSIDAELIEAYKLGDKTALATLVKRWHKLFCNKAYWLVKDKDVAKDIAQDSWTIIINRIDSLKNPNQFKFWAYRIVCNKSTDWLRKESKNQKRTLSYDTEIESKQGQYSENDIEKVMLLKAINNLPPNQNAVVKLFYLQNHSLKQISTLLNISVGTAKSRLFHAREKLKKTLKHRHYEN
ncbi:RNA polymerase sigma factor [Winogradskyella flava]|uniref:RNA polymerase sigma factor n=1 Tax=Winogradskyella flava TaxID=1884876 RepID=A0A842IYL4_9FLAO|nr:RNA polymerase sigma factor [Winogradskyella flava]MBC2846796.1 RNA polymerase sigma factor [Winogradskyella flava]